MGTELKTVEEAVAALALLFKSEKGRGWKNRVYLRKGFLVVNPDLSVDVSTVGGVAFSRGIAKQVREAGFACPVLVIAGGIKI